MRSFLLSLVIAAAPVSGQDFVSTGPGVAGQGISAWADVDASGLPDLCYWAGPNLVALIDPYGPGATGPVTLATSAQFGPNGISGLVGRTDLDADGYPELLMQDISGGSQGLWIVPTVAGTVLPPGPITNVATGGVLAHVEGDFNGDGLRDLAVSTLAGTQIYLRQAYPPLMVTAYLAVPASSSFWLEAADLDGDGYDDVLCRLNDGVAVIRGNPTGTFLISPSLPLLPPSLPVPGYLRGAGVSDFDDDGDVEGVVDAINAAMGSVFLLDLDPVSGALTSTTFVFSNGAVGSANQQARIVDVDADGADDLLLAWSVTGGMRLDMRRRDGAGAFVGGTTTLWSGPDFPTDYVDADSDGDIDLFVQTGSTGWSGALLENRAIVGEGCAGATGVPLISIGRPYTGNAGFGVAVSNAAPGAQAFLAVSTVLAPSTPGCASPIVDLTALSWPVIAAGLTSATGTCSIALPLAPGVVGGPVFAQWGVVDPSGGMGMAGTTLATTHARGVRIF